MNKRILYVEDHPNNVLLVQRIVRHEGHRFYHAVDGRLGWRMAREQRPDLIFVDLHLPGELDGFDLIRRLKMDPQLQAVPVVVLTAFGQGEVERQAVEAGCDGFLHKPADIRQVRAVIRQYIGQPVREMAPSPAGQRPFQPSSIRRS